MARAGDQAAENPEGQGRRRDGRPVNRTVFHLTHVVVGVAIGHLVGINAWLLGRHLFEGKPELAHLPWLAIVVGGALMFAFREQMDAIRETVFHRRVDGEVREVRVRRRHEVLMTMGWRLLVALFVAGAIVWGARRFLEGNDDALRLIEPLTAGRGLPPILDELVMAAYAGVAAFVTLVACETTLRATQKQGFPWQATLLFVSAILALGLSMIHIAPRLAS